MMAIGLVTILTFFFVLNLRGDATRPKNIVVSRMDIANDLVVSFSSSFLPVAVRTSAKKAVHGLVDNLSSTQSFVKDASINLSQILLTGNITEDTRILNKTESLKFKLESFANKSRDVLHIDFNYTINSIQFVQDNRTGGFRLGVELNLSYIANNSLAVWNMTRLYFVDFDITGFKDPLYAVATGGLFNNTINQTSNESWNLAHFQEHVLEGTYKLEPLAPSFLQRFENNTAGSECCGIESIFYNETLYPDFNNTNQSYVDYCFFANSCKTGYGTQLYNISGVTTGTYPFRIRAYHLDVTKYNLTSYINGTM